MALIISLRNISDLAEKSDYHYEVFLNTRCIERGYVRGHLRANGWDGLMLLLGRKREIVATYPRKSVPPQTKKRDRPPAPTTKPTKKTKS